MLCQSFMKGRQLRQIYRFVSKNVTELQFIRATDNGFDTCVSWQHSSAQHCPLSHSLVAHGAFKFPSCSHWENRMNVWLKQRWHKTGAKIKMHILIVNSSSFKMTLSNSLCKHFYIRSKSIQWRNEKICLLFDATYSSFLLNMYRGVGSCYRHAGVLVYILYFTVHIRGINVTPRVL